MVQIKAFSNEVSEQKSVVFSYLDWVQIIKMYGVIEFMPPVLNVCSFVVASWYNQLLNSY